jgi:hypothetical protein
MSRPNAPTLISPAGGELFTDSVTVQWAAPIPLSGDQRAVNFAVYFTDNYDPSDAPDWIQLAVLPSDVMQFVWRPRSGVRSNKCRVALRSINSQGERSEYVVSPNDFSIGRRRLVAPTVISPIAGDEYDKYINIQVDDSGIINTHSQRTYYQFFYNCASLSIPKTPIAQDVPIGSDPVFWNIIGLEPAPDYVLECYLQDDDGNSSTHTFTKFAIVHEGYFILDTTPPEAAIVVNNNDTFTNSRDVSVQIVSYDAATGVHSMQLLEDGGAKGQPDAIGSVRAFELSQGDGVKAVELLLQDFGGNRNNQTVRRLFEVLVEITGVTFVDVALDPIFDVLWAITNGNNGNYLYSVSEFPSQKTTFTDTPTAVGVYEGYPFVATKDSTNKGTLTKYTSFQEVAGSFIAADSVINTMEAFGSLLYLGMENGDVYTYDGVNTGLLLTMPKPLKLLVTDGNLLYAALKNDPNVYIYNGTSFVSTGA